MRDDLTPMNTDPRRVGGEYFCGYWGQRYTVTATQVEDGTLWLRCKWADGAMTTHCTSWDPKRDRVVTS